ncbi:MAG: type II toxin-antitoxin system RelE/ParE family toxin [Phaeodactylibacter sp.]|nr:type II toxin-antitoxin system RelE/ParE family toxin [Phaeodactylibacter sp.]
MIEVEFTKTAEEDYLALLDEISRRSVDEALELDAKLDALIENLQKFKHLCPPSKKFPKFRRCVLTRYISLVYEAGQQSITIISIFDSRSSNPFS